MATEGSGGNVIEKVLHAEIRPGCGIQRFGVPISRYTPPPPRSSLALSPSPSVASTLPCRAGTLYLIAISASICLSSDCALSFSAGNEIWCMARSDRRDLVAGCMPLKQLFRFAVTLHVRRTGNRDHPVESIDRSSISITDSPYPDCC